MKYESQNAGLLKIEDVKQGMRIVIVDEAYVTDKGEKRFWNVKVELPDGTHKLYGMNNMTGENFLKTWGEETKEWIGKSATVDIREARSTGNTYFVLVPFEQQDVEGEPTEGKSNAIKKLSEEEISDSIPF
jgi:hypothetical protein